jgi:ribosomal protein S19
MSRPNWKGPYIHKSLIKVKKTSLSQSWSRSTTIVPSFIGNFFNVHNGQLFMEIKVTTPMIGHKLGEFVSTRKNFSYKKQK